MLNDTNTTKRLNKALAPALFACTIVSSAATISAADLHKGYLDQPEISNSNTTAYAMEKPKGNKGKSNSGAKGKAASNSKKNTKTAPAPADPNKDLTAMLGNAATVVGMAAPIATSIALPFGVAANIATVLYDELFMSTQIPVGISASLDLGSNAFETGSTIDDKSLSWPQQSLNLITSSLSLPTGSISSLSGLAGLPEGILGSITNLGSLFTQSGNIANGSFESLKNIDLSSLTGLDFSSLSKLPESLGNLPESLSKLDPSSLENGTRALGTAGPQGLKAGSAVVSSLAGSAASVASATIGSLTSVGSPLSLATGSGSVSPSLQSVAPLASLAGVASSLTLFAGV